jgi:hypothetical protein
VGPPAADVVEAAHVAQAHLAGLIDLVLAHAEVRFGLSAGGPRLIVARILRTTFAASPEAEPELLAELPPMLDRIDAWIADGILGGPQLNAADFMVAPSLALILYRSDLMPMFEGRPALELVDRLLPEPA